MDALRSNSGVIVTGPNDFVPGLQFDFWVMYICDFMWLSDWESNLHPFCSEAVWSAMMHETLLEKLTMGKKKSGTVKTPLEIHNMMILDTHIASTS